MTAAKELIRAKRRELGLTQNELAWASGVSPITVSRIERGAHVPTQKTAARLASVLHVDAGLLREPNKTSRAGNTSGKGAGAASNGG